MIAFKRNARLALLAAAQVAAIAWSLAATQQAAHAEEAAGDRGRFTAEQLMQAEHADYEAGAFDRLNDFRGGRGLSALLVNCKVFSSADGAFTGFVYSSGRLSTNIRPQNNYVECSLADPALDPRFLRAASRAARRTQVQCAEVNGESVSTELYFRLLLTRDEDGERIEYMPNWGYDADSYGYFYKAPQRIIPMRPNDQPWFLGTHCGSAEFMTIVSVDQRGEPFGDVEYLPIKEALSPECTTAISDRILSSQFVPARSEGVPVAARHVEVWTRLRRY